MTVCETPFRVAIVLKNLALAGAGMADRVKQAVSDLRGAGTTMFSS
jgi:hypothetical protein